jgi:hypothetical protein
MPIAGECLNNFKYVTENAVTNTVFIINVINVWNCHFFFYFVYCPIF